LISYISQINSCVVIGFVVGTRLHSVQLENCPELTDLAAVAVANKLKNQLTTLSVGAHTHLV
jgi:hypothetical protein